MKLSFVIPAYNEEAFLPMCLESILHEKKKGKYDIEVIVVNNASTDSTKKVALSYPGVIVVDEPKKGISAARQAGFLKSTGDLIANIDSDSLLTPGWVEVVAERFKKRPELIALTGPVIFYDLSLFFNYLIRMQYNVDYFVYLINRFILKSGSIIQGSNFVARREALEKIGGFDPSFTFWGEDTNTAKRLNPLGPVVFTFDLQVYSSGRRFTKEGIVTLGAKYAINYFWTNIYGKPFTKTSEDIRQSEFARPEFNVDVLRMNEAIIYFKVASVFFFFSLMGGTAYLYDRTMETIGPQTASAASVILEDHKITDKVNSSLIKIKEEVNLIKTGYNSQE